MPKRRYARGRSGRFTTKRSFAKRRRRYTPRRKARRKPARKDRIKSARDVYKAVDRRAPLVRKYWGTHSNDPFAAPYASIPAPSMGCTSDGILWNPTVIVYNSDENKVSQTRSSSKVRMLMWKMQGWLNCGLVNPWERPGLQPGAGQGASRQPNQVIWRIMILSMKDKEEFNLETNQFAWIKRAPDQPNPTLTPQGKINAAVNKDKFVVYYDKRIVTATGTALCTPTSQNLQPTMSPAEQFKILPTTGVETKYPAHVRFNKTHRINKEFVWKPREMANPPNPQDYVPPRNQRLEQYLFIFNDCDQRIFDNGNPDDYVVPEIQFDAQLMYKNIADG